MWELYAVGSILLAFLLAVYAHSYVYITSFSLIVSYSIKSQSSELVHSFTGSVKIYCIMHSCICVTVIEITFFDFVIMKFRIAGLSTLRFRGLS